MFVFTFYFNRKCLRDNAGMKSLYSLLLTPLYHLLKKKPMKLNRRDAMSIDALPWRKTVEVKGDVPVAQSVVRTRV